MDPATAMLIAGGMSAGGSILGGALSGSGETEYVPQMVGKARRELYWPMMDMVAPQIGQGITPYSGQRYADPSLLQNQMFNAMGQYGNVMGMGANSLEQMMGQYNPQAGQQAMNLGMGALQSSTAPYDPMAAQNFWQKSMVDPAMQQYTQQILPAIKESYAARNAQDSGAMNRALAQSGTNLATNLSGQLADVMYQGQQSQLNRQLQSIPEAYRMGMMPTDMMSAGSAAMMAPIMGLGSLGLQAGGVQQDIAQNQLTGQQQQWSEAQPYNNPYLSMTSSLMNMQPYQGVYQQGGAGAAQMAPALGSMLGSEGFWNYLSGAPSGKLTPTSTMGTGVNMSGYGINSTINPYYANW
jgi:hypothetical protein